MLIKYLKKKWIKKMDRIEGIEQLKKIKENYKKWLYKLDFLNGAIRRTDEDILIQLKEIICACFPNYDKQGIKLNWKVEIVYVDNYCPYTGKCNKIFQKISISSTNKCRIPTLYYIYDLKSGILFCKQGISSCKFNMLIYPFKWDAIHKWIVQ